jgi:EAL domain-containing protein (putative c-di-GMP-specific phosphodiesterase class I)
VGLSVGRDDVIVRSTIDLAHNLGLTVVAEGVESDVVQAMLTAMGCDAVQGTYISAPAAVADMRTWIAHRNPLGQM